MAAAGILLIGSVFPNFEASTTLGNINFYDWLGDSWGMLYTYPFDFTPVSLTELGVAAYLESEFTAREVKVIALSSDSLEVHDEWIRDIKSYSYVKSFPYPIISDTDREVADSLGITFDAGFKVSLISRTIFIIGPDKTLKMSMYYPQTTGYNFNEIIRVVDSLQLNAKTKVATPANWKQGGGCIVPLSVSEDDAEKLFPRYRVVALPSGKPYMRFTPQPEI